MTITSQGPIHYTNLYFVGIEHDGRRYSVRIDGHDRMTASASVKGKYGTHMRTLKSLPIDVTREARHAFAMAIFGKSPYAGFFDGNHPQAQQRRLRDEMRIDGIEAAKVDTALANTL